MRTSVDTVPARRYLTRGHGRQLGTAACLILLPLLLIAGGCGSSNHTLGSGGSTTPITTVNSTGGVIPAPLSVTLPTGGTQTFTALVTSSANQSVTWKVAEGSAGGTITPGGVYTAPTGVGTFASTYHVVATSVADPTRIGVSLVFVKAPATPVTSASGVALTLSPLEVSLSVGGSEAFTGTVTGSTNTGVTYSVVEGASGGTISTAGVYTAPATAGTYHVLATSAADTTQTAQATITVLPTVTVSPATATLAIKGTQTFTATVNGVTDQTVTYTLQEGTNGGTITAAGVYTAPSAPGTYHIIATSSANPAIVGIAAITVQSGGSVLTVH